MKKINNTSSYNIPKYPILKTEIDYNPVDDKSIYDTFYKEISFENFTINISSSKDNFICTKDHGVVKVVDVIKVLSGEIKFAVMKYSKSTLFQNPIMSDIIKIFYVHEIIPNPHLIYTDVDLIEYECFLFPINDHKPIALALLHTT